MKRLQLPKNKFLRLLINVFLVAIYYCSYIYIESFLFLSTVGYTWRKLTRQFGESGNLVLTLIIFLLPIFFITRYIWFGRILPRLRITRSKD